MMMRTPEMMIPPRGNGGSGGSVSNKIELFEKRISPEKSPRMMMGGSGGGHRRPPSPGMLPLTPNSNKMGNTIQESPSSGSSKRKPMPGGFMGPPSPGGVSVGSNKGKGQKKPSPDGFTKRPPSPGMNYNTSPRRQHSPGKRMEPKRFVFSAEATGITPSQIEVSSPSHYGHGNALNSNSNQMNSLSKKNQNPLRNNPNFLHTLTEDDSDGEEYEGNDKDRNELRKIAQAAASLEDSPGQEMKGGGGEGSGPEQFVDQATKKEQEKFANPAKHWVNLRPVKTKDDISKKEISSSDVLLQNFSSQLSVAASTDVSVVSFTDGSPRKRLTPGKKAVVEKLRESRGRSARQQSVSPSMRQRENSSESVNEKLKSPSTHESNEVRGRKAKQSNKEKSKENDNASQSPSRKLIKPAAIRASGPIFFPIRKRTNGDDGSVSSYTINSFQSAVSAKNSDSKRGGSLSDKVRRASSRSPMRYRPFEEAMKSKNGKDDTSVKKGISIAMKKLEAYEKTHEEEKRKKKQSLSRLNSNLARLKHLKEEQKEREKQQKRQSKDETKPKFHYYQNSEGKSRRKKVNKPQVADDEFTVDCEVLSIGAESKSSIESEEQKTNKQKLKKNDFQEKPKHHSQWAEIMQNRLGETDEDEESSFEDDFKNEISWDADSPARAQPYPLLSKNESPIRSLDEPTVSHPSFAFRSPVHSPERPPQSPHYSPHQIDTSHSDIEIEDISPHVPHNKIQMGDDNPNGIGGKLHNDIGDEMHNGMGDDMNVVGNLQPEYLPPLDQVEFSPKREKETDIIPQQTFINQLPKNPPPIQYDPRQNNDINPYIGPYAKLIPRTTNPWIVRTNLPTLSSSLTNFRSIQPPPTSIPGYDSTHLHGHPPTQTLREPSTSNHEAFASANISGQAGVRIVQEPKTSMHATLQPAYVGGNTGPQIAQEQAMPNPRTFPLAYVGGNDIQQVQYPDPTRAFPDPATAYPDPATTYPAPAIASHHPTTAYPNPAVTYPAPATAYPDPSTAYPAPAKAHPDPATKYPDQNPYSINGLPNGIKPNAEGGKSLEGEDFVLSHSTPDSDGINYQKAQNGDKKGGDGEASTLIGQEHIPSNGSGEESKTSATLSRWWENNYASAQDQDLNKVIKRALSQMDKNVSKKNPPEIDVKNTPDFLDSDDDVFDGLESPRDHPSQRKQLSPRPQTQSTKRKPKKVENDNELDTIMSGDRDGDEETKSSPKQKSSHNKSKKSKTQPSKESKDQKEKKKTKGNVSSNVSSEETYNDVTVTSSGSTSHNDQSQAKAKKKSSKAHREKASSNKEDFSTIERVSSRVSSRSGGILNKYACGILDPISSSDTASHFSRNRGRSKKTKSRRPRDDDTYDDGTFYTNDFTEYSSRSGERSVGSQTNDSQTYDSRLHLSDNERKVWDAWDKKDNESSFTGASTFDPSLASKHQQKELHDERRARAHEKLLMHAYIALSKPPPEVMREKDEIWQPDEQNSYSENQAPERIQNSNNPPLMMSDSHYASDSENKMPTSFHGNENDDFMPMRSGRDFQKPLGSNQRSNQISNQNINFQPQGPSHNNDGFPPTISSHENASFQPSVAASDANASFSSFKQPGPPQDARSMSSKGKVASVSSVKTGSSPLIKRPKSIAFQKHVLEKFCVRIKHTAVEVLKLNREKKWQTRYLTVSKEGTWLKNSNKSDACFCPLGLLWVKKFNKSREHSILAIDKQGKGGMLLANLVEVTVVEDYGENSTLTKKQLERYHDSCIVNLRGASSFVTLRCEKNDADAVLVGCNAITDVLRGSNVGRAMRPQSKMSGSSVTSNLGASSIASSHRALSKTFVANDLWEA